MGTMPDSLPMWLSGRGDPAPDELDKLAKLASLAHGLAAMYSPFDAREWLFAPQRLLGMATPASRIEENRLDEAVALIRQLQDGAFV